MRPRRVYIRAGVELIKYGYTAGCQGCAAARDGRPPLSHSEDCRVRIESEMEKEAAEGVRVERARKRQDDSDGERGKRPRIELK
eukprot:13643187-Heterocapsa_arctica.AAC.1